MRRLYRIVMAGLALCAASPARAQQPPDPAVPQTVLAGVRLGQPIAEAEKSAAAALRALTNGPVGLWRRSRREVFLGPEGECVKDGRLRSQPKRNCLRLQARGRDGRVSNVALGDRLAEPIFGPGFQGASLDARYAKVAEKLPLRANPVLDIVREVVRDGDTAAGETVSVFKETVILTCSGPFHPVEGGCPRNR